jgi:N-carbamoylputrescine amidase
MHIPDDPGFYEKFYFTPGDLGYKVFDTKYAKVGVLICWDQWYPEAARITALMGAEILCIPRPSAGRFTRTCPPTANSTTRGKPSAFARGSQRRARGVGNRVGQEAEIRFWGGSFIASPFGRVIYQATHDQEELHVEELTLSDTDHYRTHWPFLRDRRIDSYLPVTKRYIDSEA